MVKKKYMVAAVSAALVATTAVSGSVARAIGSGDQANQANRATVVTTAASTAQVSYTPTAIKWGKCDDAGLKSLGAQCGFLTVPLDYDKPQGKTIKLAVSRVKHTVKKAKYQGVMLVNPGGPGGSGLSLSSLGQYVPDGAGDAYDWIGFDPRGVGSSKPSLTCDGSYFSYDRPKYVPGTAKDEKTWLKRAKTYAAKCEKAGGALLDNVKTTDTVKDMDVLRKALGKKKINFYGFSYGTYLGQVYSTMYPGRVRRMVLDGVVDPRDVWYDANLNQDVAFDKNMDTFFAWVAKYNSVYRLGKTEAAVEKEYYKQLKALDKKAAGGKIGGDEWTDIFLSAGYYVFGWEDVADAFAGWVHDGDWKTLKAMYDDSQPQGPGEDNGYAMYLATQCTDVQWPTSWAKWKKDNAAVHQKAPFETWANAWFNAPCLYWDGEVGKPVKVDGSKAPAILLIAETHDAATPYAGALEVRKRFPKSVLIEGVGGTTHSGSLNGVSCTDDAIADYLTDGTLPSRAKGNASDKKCDPVPQPVPAGASSSGKSA
ncbi:alpha/beta fold hydrolase [Kineosporia sp. J2-2]|uniref:Alpha/beta fold hydrolase n=1 Tax=Kineosporia corallincola TaxID=2835133 RepID=A0ABS5T900_9ACTN|nr:alpha/beta hydrolase [Kineosporia corallincola]MBT0767554.1 alpha/beta fold hydrolase [Kineosporia corallincola]